MSDTEEFARRKATGTAAETHLSALISLAGGIVECHQQNRDATRHHDGAAVARHGPATVYLPDLSVIWPSHPIRRFSCEVKAKSPLEMGGFGWDTHAFRRACRWSELTGDPVFYCVRDLSHAPLPPPGELDDLDFWHCASVWKLRNSPRMFDGGEFHYWPAADFHPLAVLLTNLRTISATVVPVIHVTGQPPLVL